MNTPVKILLVEDETHVISFIRKGLMEEGYELAIATDGEAGLSLAREQYFDLIILDIMLPKMNGLVVCSHIRSINKHTPILFLTALGTAENIVIGLESGADDYLIKPFKFIELSARIRSLLRRVQLQDTSKNTQSYTFADIELNDTTKTVFKSGKELALTSTEYKLLLFFLKNPKKVLSRTTILEQVWDINFDIGTNVVDVYVNYLRKKIDDQHKKLIHTVVGMGYILKENS